MSPSQEAIEPSIDATVRAPQPVLPAQPVDLTRTQAPRIRVWDLPTRLFHWALAAAVATAIVTGKLGGTWMAVHAQAGLVIVGLVAFRLVWGFVGTRHARFLSFLPTPARVLAYLRGRWRGEGHNPLGALSVLALLALLAVQAATGLFSNDDIAFTGPLIELVDESLSNKLTGLHHQLGDVLLILVGLHVAAIAFYLLVKRHNLVGPMVTGWARPASPASRSAGRGRPAALVLAVAVALVAVVLASGLWFKPEPAPEPQDVPAAVQQAPSW